MSHALCVCMYVCTPRVCIHVSQCAPTCRGADIRTRTRSPTDTQSPPGAALSPDTSPGGHPGTRCVCVSRRWRGLRFKRVMANQSQSSTHAFTIHPSSTSTRRLFIPSRCPWSCGRVRWWTSPPCTFDCSQRRVPSRGARGKWEERYWSQNICAMLIISGWLLAPGVS